MNDDEKQREQFDADRYFEGTELAERHKSALAASGTEAAHRERRLCPNCNGNGDIRRMTGVTTCAECGGYGWQDMPAQAAASPEAAPRCAHCRAEIISCSGQELGCQGWTHRYGLSHYCTNAYGETSENGTVAAPMSSNSFTVGPDGTSPYHVNNVPAAASPEGEGREAFDEIKGLIAELADFQAGCISSSYEYGLYERVLQVLATLRQSAAPSGPLGTPSKLDGSMATAASDLDRLKAAYDDFEDYFVRNYPGPRTIIHKPKWHAPKIFQAVISALKLNDAIATTESAPQQLQAESKTGAVTDASTSGNSFGPSQGNHERGIHESSSPSSTGVVTETK